MRNSSCFLFFERGIFMQKLLSFHREYTFDGKKYFYDKCRKKYILKTPEEIIRQTTVKFFRWKLHTPLRNIQTEVSMKRYGYPERRDRADILILQPDGNTILAVVECKAAYISIDEKVIAQLLRYAKALNSEFAFATNGSDLRVFRFDQRSGYKETECPASYKRMCRSNYNETPQAMTLSSRPDLKTLENITYVRRHYDSYIGRQTREHLKKKRYWPQQ